jgi:hypothetical protein
MTPLKELQLSSVGFLIFLRMNTLQNEKEGRKENKKPIKNETCNHNVNSHQKAFCVFCERWLSSLEYYLEEEEEEKEE